MAHALAGNEYRCFMCGSVYQLTDFDAEAERKANFPECEGEPCETICDDCYKALLKRMEFLES